MCEEAYLGWQFVWHAAQSIEKYVKCIIVLNGRSIKTINHATVKDLMLIEGVITSLLPSYIDLKGRYKIRPKLLKFAKEDFIGALKRFEKEGAPQSRYKDTGLMVQPYDLQKLDFIVFQLRRLCFPILGNQKVFNDLTRDPDYSPNLDIDMIRKGFQGEETRSQALRRDNVIFFPELAAESKGAFKSQMEMKPLLVAEASKLLSQADKEWLGDMTRDSI